MSQEFAEALGARTIAEVPGLAMMNHGTRFMESEAILDALIDDYDGLIARLATATDWELSHLMRAAAMLASSCQSVVDRRRRDRRKNEPRT